MNAGRCLLLLHWIGATLSLHACAGGTKTVDLEGADTAPDRLETSAPCNEGARACDGTWTTTCLAGGFVPVADCAAEGWSCLDGRCAAAADETATEAAWRVRLDDLQVENARAATIELDRFGGWKNAPAELGEPAPGDFFRVAKRGGAWWFLTPDGHVFLSKGVTDVGPAAEERLRAWRFNSVGPWSSASMGERLAHASVILDSAGHAPRYAADSVITDYWSPGFVEHAARVAVERAGPFVEDPWLIGYFLDNELVWVPNWATDLTVLQLYVDFPFEAPGRAEALTFLREHAGTLDAFEAVWGTSLADWDALQGLTSADLTPTTDAAKAVTDAFQLHAFRRYAAVAIAALRQVDPHHLVLGCRFFDFHGDALFLEAAKVFDVVSLAFYWEHPPVAELDALGEALDRPVLIEEFSFKGKDSGLPNVKNWAPVVPTQEDRALAYDAFVQTWMSRPYAVAFHWYKWFDNPRKEGDPFSGDNFGLIDAEDQPYLPLVRLAREVNGRVEAWHAGGGAP